MTLARSDAIHRYFQYVEATNISTCELCKNKLKQTDETEKPVEAQEPVESEEPVEGVKTVEADQSVETQKPDEAQKLVETENPSEVEESVEAPVEAEEPVKVTKTKKKIKCILNCLDTAKLRNLSETEKKMFRICRNKIKSIQRLEKMMTHKKRVDKIDHICNDESVKQLFNLNLNDSFVSLLESNLTIWYKSKQYISYNLEQKLLALSLYKKSPPCYRLLSNIFDIPCPAMLNKLLIRVPMEPGINKKVFAGLKLMSQTSTEDENLCSLLFQEMSLAKHLSYNAKTDCVDGFEDHGTNHERTKQIACNALVFMLCGLMKPWKQPVALYFLNESNTSNILSMLIKEVITETFDVGLNVIATICEMTPRNSKALRDLGATTESPYFQLKSHEIVTIADPPHLLVSLRDMFVLHDIEIPTHRQPDGNVEKGIATWDHIMDFYVNDNMNPHFVFAPALTESHVDPKPDQKKQVKLAAEIFSHTVTAGVLAKVATKELPEEALVTAILLTKFDNLFDALNANSKELRRGKKFTSNVTARSPHLEYFAEMKNFVKSMKLLDETNSLSLSGWIQTIGAVERLWNNLKILGITSLSTRRLNLDPLENFFSCIKYNCESSCKPTVSQFITGFQTAILTNLKNSEKNKNCEDDDAILANNFNIFWKGEKDEYDSDEHITGEECDYSILGEPALAEEVDAITSDIETCAFICRIIINKINNNCTQCVELLKSNPTSEVVHDLQEKENAQNNASFHLESAVNTAVKTCTSFLTENLHIEQIRDLAMLLLETECKNCFEFLKQCNQHYKHNVNGILNHVFRVTLRRCILLRNKEILEEENSPEL